MTRQKTNILHCLLVSLLLLAACLSMAPRVARADEREELQESLRKLTVERDRLRAELAMARLNIEQLQNQVNALKAAAESDAPATQPSAGGGSAGAGDTNAPSRREWIVEVTNNTAPDVSALEAECRTAKDSMASLTQRLTEANKHAADLAKPRDYYYGGGGRYTETWDPYNHKYVRQYEISDEQKKAIEEAKQNVAKLERQISVARVRVTRLEQDLAAKQSNRTIDGRLEDGTAVRITAGGAAKAAGEAMAVGQKYRVSGTGGNVGGVVRITLRTAVPAEK